MNSAGRFLPLLFITYVIVLILLTLKVQFKSETIDLGQVLANQGNNYLLVQLGDTLHPDIQSNFAEIWHESSLRFILNENKLEKMKHFNDIYIYDADILRARFLAYFFYLKYGISSKILLHVR